MRGLVTGERHLVRMDVGTFECRVVVQMETRLRRPLLLLVPIRILTRLVITALTDSLASLILLRRKIATLNRGSTQSNAVLGGDLTNIAQQRLVQPF